MVGPLAQLHSTGATALTLAQSPDSRQGRRREPGSSSQDGEPRRDPFASGFFGREGRVVAAWQEGLRIVGGDVDGRWDVVLTNAGPERSWSDSSIRVG